LKHLKTIGAVMCVAALAVPAGVSAKKPDNPGSNGKGHNKCAPNSKKPGVGFVVKGTFGSADSGARTITLATVTSANTHAKRVVQKGATNWTTNALPASVKFVGGDPFGTTPPAAGTSVQLIGKIAKPHKGCTADNSYTIKKVIFKTPDQGTTEAAQSA
jgi:hypothetical protein